MIHDVQRDILLEAVICSDASGVRVLYGKQTLVQKQRQALLNVGLQIAGFSALITVEQVL